MGAKNRPVSTPTRACRSLRREMSKTNGKIAFVGAGNMAGALIRGLVEGGARAPAQVMASDPHEARRDQLREQFGIGTTSDNLEALRFAQTIVLATKPQIFNRLLLEIAPSVTPDHLLISVAAGIPCAVIESYLHADARVVRAMPNTPALIRTGATALACGSRADTEDLESARQIFNQVGETILVDESLLDAVTGLSGSGPAYVFLIIEALADAGVKVGLNRDAAQLLAAQTVLGSAQLLKETGDHPGRLKDMVTSPGGTAIAGLHTLEAGGLRTTLINAVEAATRRASELGAHAVRTLSKPPPKE